MLKLYYSIHNSIRICKRGVVAAYLVVWECVVEQWLGVHRIRRTPSQLHSLQQIPTQHYMPPQHLVYEMN